LTLAVVTPRRRRKIEEVVSKRSTFVTVLLDGVHDPHNISAILRSVDAFGFLEVHAVEQGKSSIRFSPRIARGSQYWVRFFQYPSSQIAGEILQKKGYELWLAMPPEKADCTLFSYSPLRPTAFVFGNEHGGASEEIIRMASRRFTIPMYGMVESLNVSVAVAITLFYVRTLISTSPSFLLTSEEKEILIKEYERRSFS